jgi:hypothetical protein
MAYIVNDPDQKPNIYYSSDNIDQSDMNRQFLTESSTMTEETEGVMKEFAKHAGEYIKLAKKKKMYDFKTKNKSFLDLYNDLYKLGIKNNKFFLVLYDKDLQGVDVYSPVLPKDLQIKIMIECMINPWYWMREVLRIPVDGKPIEVGGGVRYRIDRNNAACWYLFLNGIDHYQSKPRQQGKTQDCIAKFHYAYLFGNLSSTMLFFNKDQDQANINLYRLKCQRDMLPSWMQMRTVVLDDGKIDKGIDNTKSIRNPITGNSIVTMGKAVSKEGAMKLGRGATAALQYYDEFDFIPFQTEIMGAASFAYATAATNAKANNATYCRILSSTPGDLDTRDGREATEFVSHMLKWTDGMFDDDIEKIKKIIGMPPYNKFIFVESSWKELKLSMSWYEEQCSLVSYNAEKIMREIDLKRIHGSSQSPFNRNAIMYIMSHQITPITRVDYSKNLCPINIYEKLFRNKPYMMVIDPSEGLAEDNNAMTLINPYTQKVAAEFKSPYISQPDMCKLMCQFLDEYCPKAMIVVESNRGRELINCFLETRYRFQLYYDDGKLGDKVIEKTDPFGRLKHEAMIRRSYGLWTGSNRHEYYAILENLMEERKDLVCTPYIVEDVCGLIRKPNGRVEAGEGNHDDNIMSYLMGLFIYFNAPYEKLAEYGIKRGETENLKDYDEKGNITEEGTLNKLRDMLPSLPENFRDVILGALSQKDPVKDAMEYAKEIKAAKAQYAQGSSLEIDDSLLPAITQTNYPDDQEFWGDYDRSVWDSNPDMQISDFDPEDYI